MAQISKTVKKHDGIKDVVNNLNAHEASETWQENGVFKIIKAVTWPRFLTALRYTVNAMAASAVIGTCLYCYGYGINQIIALLR